MTAGAARDLGHFCGGQPPMPHAVELGKAGEGDMGDVQVQPHADGIGGDEVVDLARLIERDLGVARLRRERAHHHCRAAAEAPQHLGDGIDLVG